MYDGYRKSEVFSKSSYHTYYQVFCNYIEANKLNILSINQLKKSNIHTPFEPKLLTDKSRLEEI